MLSRSMPLGCRARAVVAVCGLMGAGLSATGQPPAPPVQPPAGPSVTPSGPAPSAEPPAPAPTEQTVSSVTLRRVGTLSLPAAEFASYDAAGKRAFVTSGGYVTEVDLRRPPWPGLARLVGISEAAGFGVPGTDPKACGGVAGVAVDPAGRNIAAATVAPPDFASREGKVVFFHMPTGTILKKLTVGFSPGAVAFTSDGSKLIVLDRGKAVVDADGAVLDPVGGISVVNLTGLGDAETLVRQLNQEHVKTVGFEGPVLDRAVAKDGPEADRPNGGPVRIHPKNKDKPAKDLEPQAMTIAGGSVYVALRANNAIGVFDLASMAWTRLVGLGSFEQTIDASDTDGGIEINDKVLGMPMPDQIAAYQANGKTYLVTTNRGDDRGESNDHKAALGDRARARDLAKWNQLSGSLMSKADLSDPVLGRLYISTIDGFDAEGKIEKPVMFGTRSLSVWDAQTLRRVGDTGSAFEQIMAQKAKDLFNAERVGLEDPPEFQFDNRSADRGPEPAGVTVAPFGNRTFAFVTLARPGAAVVVDISDPAAPKPIDLVAGARNGDIDAEGVVLVPAEQSASSEPTLLVCTKNPGFFSVYRVMVR